MSKATLISKKMVRTSRALIQRVHQCRKINPSDSSVDSAMGGFGIDPMLIALAMELALKAWITLDRGSDPIRTHNLIKLFRMLDPKLQESFEKDFHEQCPWFKEEMLYRTIEMILDCHANAFVQWRYMHEIDTERFSMSDMEYVLDVILKPIDQQLRELL